MTPERAADGAIVVYGPLSIDDARHHEDDDISHSSLWSDNTASSCCYRRSLRVCCRFCHRPPKIVVISLVFALGLLISVFIVTDKVFHTSIQHLLHIIIFGASTGGSNTGLLVNATCLVNPARMDSISIAQLNLTRTAVAFAKCLTDNIDIVSHGFNWDEDDSDTYNWRPQGVTTYHYNTPSSGQRFALVSWYGRAEEGYANRGGRVSFVDVSTMQHEGSTGTPTMASDQYYSYTHVLLVDDNYCTLPNIHVGGIEQVNGTLYVADSRDGEMNILGFDIERELYELSSSDEMLGFRYILRQSSSFRSPTKPSFLSYDADHSKFVVGTYFRCGGKVGKHTDSRKCFDRSENRIEWVDMEHINDNIIDNSCWKWHYFSEMQGATSAIVNNVTRVWVSSSYGPIADSHLHVVDVAPNATLDCLGASDIVHVVEDATIFRYPPGLEDLHIEQLSADRYMWMLTEFEPRLVFATTLSLILG
jgi:hypothetical protein